MDLNNIEEQELIAKLHDIEAIDEVSYFPLSPSALILLAVIFLLIITSCFYFYRRFILVNQRNNLLNILSKLHNVADKKETIVKLSVIIRQIAIMKYSRKECASIEGLKWLEWLERHDPSNFQWLEKAKWLMIIPYSPSEQIPENTVIQVKEAINAIKKWLG